LGSIKTSWFSSTSIKANFTSLDVNGSLALREAVLVLTNADNNNVAIAGYSFFRITGPTTSFAITGIANGFDGKVITLYNATVFSLTIKNLNPSSASANQIKTLTGSDLIFAAANSSVALQYSLSETKWIVIAQQNLAAQTVTFNQSANSVFGTAALTVLPSTPQTVIPGLTQTIDVPAGSVAYISSVGALVTTAAIATGFSVVDIFLTIDGSITANGGYQRVYAMLPIQLVLLRV